MPDPRPQSPSVPGRPGNPEALSTLEFYQELFAQAEGRPYAPPSPKPEPEPVRPISTLEFYRQLFAPKPEPEPVWALQGTRYDARIPGGLSVAAYCDQLAAAKAARERAAAPALRLGPRPGLIPPALPAGCRRVRGGDRLLSWEMLVNAHGRIAAKRECAAGTCTAFSYAYDPAGHLLRVWRDGRLAEEYAYDAKGARRTDWSPHSGTRTLEYDGSGRLVRAGNQQYAYASGGTLARVRGEGWQTECQYGPNLALARAVLPGGCELRYVSAPDGRLLAKYANGRLVERYAWRSPIQLAAWRDELRGEEMRFLYQEGRRTPCALELRGQGYSHLLLLGCDQVGSLKVVANRHGEMLKTLDYDSFGNLLADSNPEFFLPLGFAGGLVDRHTGQVRFGRRDYMPSVGRFTAQDPLGAAGGDHDPYDYCVDDPVGRIDPEGLKDTAALAAGDGILDGIGSFFTRMGENVGNWLTGSEDQSEAANPATTITIEKGKDMAAGADRDASRKITGIAELNTTGYETPATSATHSTKRGPALSGDEEKLLKTTPGAYIAPNGIAINKDAVPPLPPGASYERNMQEMQGRGLEPGAWLEFKDKVQPRGEWDYKTKGSQFEPAGNFNYGAAAEAMGIPDVVADRTAGAVHRWEHSPAKQWDAPPLVRGIGQAADAAYHQAVDPAHGDDPRDQENIRRGRVYAKQWEREQANKSK